MTSDDHYNTIGMRPISAIDQIFTVFSAQMRLFFRNKLLYMILILTALVPILGFSGLGESLLNMFDLTATSAYLLILLPLMAVAIPALLCGKLISSEFKDRTIYLNLPLPMSRTTFYIGKFLAGYVVSLGAIWTAMGFAFLAGQILYEPTYPYDLGMSMLVCAGGVFAVSAMAFALGTFLRRGSGILVMFLMLLLPFILLFTTLIVNPIESFEIEDPLGALKLLPMYAPHQSLWLIDNGFGGIPLITNIFTGGNSILYIIASIIWGMAFLVLGTLRMKNKEM